MIDYFQRKLVPGAGLEPARPYGQQILSLLRLPITPLGHKKIQDLFAIRLWPGKLLSKEPLIAPVFVIV